MLVLWSNQMIRLIRVSRQPRPRYRAERPWIICLLLSTRNGAARDRNMKIDVASARARAGSRYPKPFDEPCQNKTRRRLGLAAGLTQFGAICWSWARAPGPVSAIGTLTKTSLFISSEVRSCSSPMMVKLSSTPAIAPASRPVSAMAITCRTAARRPHWS